jgi:hypothetical protein
LLDEQLPKGLTDGGSTTGTNWVAAIAWVEGGGAQGPGIATANRAVPSGEDSAGESLAHARGRPARINGSQGLSARSLRAFIRAIAKHCSTRSGALGWGGLSPSELLGEIRATTDAAVLRDDEAED